MVFGFNPLGWDAKTKEAGEQAVIAAGGSWAIARTTVVYGYAGDVRANFVLWLVGEPSLPAGPIVDDQIGSPTLAENLAEMVLTLARKPEIGMFNTAGADVLSRLDFSRRIAKTFGLDASLMDLTTTASLGQAAPRPLKAGLLMDKFRAAFPNVPVLSVAEGLAVVKRQFARPTFEKRGRRARISPSHSPPRQSSHYGTPRAGIPGVAVRYTECPRVTFERSRRARWRIVPPPQREFTMAHPVAVSDGTFEAEVLKAETPVLVDFWAEWCPPCKMIAPHLDKIAEEQEGSSRSPRSTPTRTSG